MTTARTIRNRATGDMVSRSSQLSGVFRLRRRGLPKSTRVLPYLVGESDDSRTEITCTCGLTVLLPAKVNWKATSTWPADARRPSCIGNRRAYLMQEACICRLDPTWWSSYRTPSVATTWEHSETLTFTRRT